MAKQKQPPKKVLAKKQKGNQKRSKQSSTYDMLESFIGEEVIVMHSVMRTIAEETDAGVGFSLAPCSTQGILMDIDQNFIGIGDGESIETVIHKTQIVALVKHQDPKLSIYDSMLNGPMGGSC